MAEKELFVDIWPDDVLEHCIQVIESGECGGYWMPDGLPYIVGDLFGDKDERKEDWPDRDWLKRQAKRLWLQEPALWEVRQGQQVPRVLGPKRAGCLEGFTVDVLKALRESEAVKPLTRSQVVALMKKISSPSWYGYEW